MPAFFQDENQNCPPSLSQKGMLHSAVKSWLLDNLEQVTNTKYEQLNVDNVIFDDTTMINVWISRKSRAAKQYDGYAAQVIVPYTEYYA